MLLKSGILGLIAAAGYMTGFFSSAARLAPCNIILGVTLAGPLVIDVFLYASNKWLDFGILLTILAAAPVVAKRA